MKISFRIHDLIASTGVRDWQEKQLERMSGLIPSINEWCAKPNSDQREVHQPANLPSLKKLKPFEPISTASHAAVILALIFLLGLPPLVPAQPSDTPLPQFWQTDGPVLALLVTNGVTYLGGAFSFVGPDSGPAGVVDLTTAQARSGFPKINGAVLTAVPDGSGGWFVGGSFTNVGSVIRTNLAHILADNSVDPAWTPNANGQCRALVLSGGQLYVGGAFTRVGGQVRNRLAALNPATGAATSWNPNANNVVNVLTLDPPGTTLYAGGSFTTIGSSNRNRIAALNLGTGLATSWDPNAGSGVTTIAVSGSTVYVGGNFTTAASTGGAPRNHIAALDAVTGLASAWNPNIAGGSVSNLVVGAGVAYAGGSFTSVGGITRNGLAAIDLGTALPTSWDPSPDTNVNTLLLTGSTLYVGGAFTNIAGVDRRLIAAFDTATGTPLSWAPPGSDLDLGVPPAVFTMSITNNDMLVGGSFASIGGAVRNNIAAVDNSSGAATVWNPSADGAVAALAFATNTLYVGGSFTNIGGQPRNRLAALADSDGHALAWNPDVRGRAGAAVLALALSSNLLYAGGANITNVGGQIRTNLFAVSLSGGGSPTGWNPPALRTATAGSVTTLFLDGSTIVVGGDFSSIGGQLRTNLAALSSAGVVESWAPNPNGGVSNLVVSGTNVYVGGNFTTIGSVLRNRIAKVDRTTGLSDVTWNPDASGTGARVCTLVLDGAVLYSGGQFTGIGGAFRTNAGALRLSNGQAGLWQPNCGGTVRTMVLKENAVFVGGNFLSVGTNTHSYFSVFPAATVIQSPAVAAGQFGFQIRSGSGSAAVIQRADNMVSPIWSNISTNPVTGSLIPFTDPQPVGLDPQYYRALMVP